MTDPTHWLDEPCWQSFVSPAIVVAVLRVNGSLPFDGSKTNMNDTLETSTNYADCTVAELVIQAKSGDRAAIEVLFARYQRQVQAVAFRKLGNWDEALELSQDAFVQAFRRLDQLQVPEAFGGWIRMITQRLASTD